MTPFRANEPGVIKLPMERRPESRLFCIVEEETSLVEQFTSRICKMMTSNMLSSFWTFSRFENITDPRDRAEGFALAYVNPSFTFIAPELLAWSTGPLKPYHLDNYSDCRLFPRTLAEIETNLNVERDPTAHANDLQYHKRKALKDLVCRMLTDERLEPLHVLQEFYSQFPCEGDGGLRVLGF
ncbi:hypothetical protein K435DRAFT_968070 [Dendrothele bispora CBS 962.96]|uniref:Uncharacterized protein n=1 Tax=Dendrothele bispora (strain CBS 962.96) TaxID=1314807 RepID=A0A4S8LR14_DENBC|nr:hypothetical protein K435DRAFT_968070 [Dendrothele bispora CBS 962.96]